MKKTSRSTRPAHPSADLGTQKKRWSDPALLLATLAGVSATYFTMILLLLGSRVP